MRYNVYRQDKPKRTGSFFKAYGADGKLREEEWHRADLTLVGRADSFEEAKSLTSHPIIEERK